MKVKDLIMELIYCDPEAEIEGLTFDDADENTAYSMKVKKIEDYDNTVLLIFDNLDVGKFSEDGQFEEFTRQVLNWAKDKDLLHEENADKQFMKFVEEVFEFKTEMDNVLSYTDPYVDEVVERMELEMGDIFVTLIILCSQLNLDPVSCLARAYEKIKDRTGKTINGQFIKSEDLED
ncbi:MazG-like family protein [Peptoniphilus vaginalis]|uniref:MazG-like family protein n=1 Tax=Peptoniphilus vaginalis TaxID=1756987 RepID=UPI0023F7240A|nr:MazG-like family protein [Peptoniphilus vaginalis]